MCAEIFAIHLNEGKCWWDAGGEGGQGGGGDGEPKDVTQVRRMLAAPTA